MSALVGTWGLVQTNNFDAYLAAMGKFYFVYLFIK